MLIQLIDRGIRRRVDNLLDERGQLQQRMGLLVVVAVPIIDTFGAGALSTVWPDGGNASTQATNRSHGGGALGSIIATATEKQIQRYVSPVTASRVNSGRLVT